MGDRELYDYCREAGTNARKWKNRFVAALPEVYKRQLYRKRGFGSIFEFAAKIGGVSKNVVEDVLNLDKKLEDKPALKELIPKVGLHKVRVVANIAKQSDQKIWAKKVQTMSKPALETHVRDIRNSDPGIGIPTAPQESIFDNDFETFTAKLDPKIILKLKIIKQKMRKGTTWNEVFKQLTESAIPEPQPQKNPKPSNPKSRQVSTKQKREALIKTNRKCSVPGCNKPAQEIHHVKPWAINQSHENLKPLCKPHHELDHQTDSTIDKKFRQYKLQASMF
ncbi:HNH endonuclease signature motif containing protein [Patescibacteria group bacterium]